MERGSFNKANTVSERVRLILSGVGIAILWYAIYSQLQNIASWLTYSLFSLPRESHLASAFEFFLFEVPKVLMLLVIVVFVVGIIRTFFTPERTRRILAGKREYVGNVLGALLGIVTPFCSCSAVPLFIGFVESGVPLGVTFSFLIAAPMINEVAVVLLFAMFGFKVTAIYIGAGLFIAIGAGFVLGRLSLERFVEPWVYAVKVGNGEGISNLSVQNRLEAGTLAVKEIVGKVWLYVIAGIAIGAGIHGYVPTGLMASFMGRNTWWSVPLAVVLGVPMYSNAAGIVPIVQALIEKGASLGTALAFMMAVIALSLPEAVILRKVLRPQLLCVFFGVVAFGIILVGYLFNSLF